MQTITLNVKGMTCMGCVASVKRVLGAIAGVGEVDVSLEKAQATIQYDAAKADTKQFRTAIEEAGYEVSGA